MRIVILFHYSDANFIDIHKAFDLWLSEMLIREQGIIPNQMETKMFEEYKKFLGKAGLV